MEGDYSFIYDPEILKHSPSSVLFIYREDQIATWQIGGDQLPKARNLFIRDCGPSQVSPLRGYCFQFRNQMGSCRTMMTGSAWWVHLGVPWYFTWGLTLSSHSFWSFPIEEGVMDSSVVTRSGRALGAEKLPITSVVPS